MRRLAIVFFAMLLAVAAFAQTPISDIQFVDDPATDDASPLDGQTVTVQGWVTFEPMSMGGGQFFMADAAGAWNGIAVYVGGSTTHLGFGWEVEVTGVVSEYFGLTQIDASEGSVTVLDDRQDAEAFWAAYHNGDIDPIEYTTVDEAAMLSDVATAEAYEGVLVRLDEVSVAELPGQYGEWVVTDGNGNCAVDNPSSDDFGYAHYVLEGQSYDRLQGVLNYSFSEYKILPEIAFDLKVTVDMVGEYYDQVAYFQQVRPMDMTVRMDADDEYYIWDHSYASRVRYGLNQGGNDPYGEAVTVRAWISYPTSLGYAGDGAKFIMADYLQTDEMMPWMSVLSYNEDPGTLGELYEGDEIIFYGEVGEYSTGPSNMTELWITDPFDFVSEENPVPAPAVIDVEQLRNSMYAERWGNVFVEMQNVVVTDIEPTPYELFAVDDDLDDNWGAVKVDDDSDAMGDYPDPSPGANIESINGWIYHHFGVLDESADNIDWVYKICPAYPDDILIGEGPPNILAVARDFGVVPADQAVVVSATIADNEEVDNAMIYHRIDDGDWMTIEMDQIGDLEWEGTIPPQPQGAFIEYYVQAEDDLGQTSTAPANLDMNYFGYWANDDLTVHDVQYTPWASGSSPYAGYDVTVTGVVTTTEQNALDYVATEDDTPPVYCIQSGVGAPYNSLMVHIPDLLPELGDEITITGTVVEDGTPWSFKYGGNTRVVGLPGATTINSSGNDVTAYETSIGAINSALEPHESVLVTLNDVNVSAINSYDWGITDGTGSFLLDDDMIAETHDDIIAIFDGLEPGTTIGSLTGIVTYSFGTWKLEVRVIDDFGNVSVDEDAIATPSRFALEPVYPNPFNPTANVRFSLPASSPVTLMVYNMMGQQVDVLVNETMQAGTHTAFWNAQNFASGTYFLRLVAGEQQQIQKMILMK